MKVSQFLQTLQNMRGLPCGHHIRASDRIFYENFTRSRILMSLVELCEFRTLSAPGHAKHRHSYRKFWRQRSASQYPTHPGSDFEGAKSRYSVNLQVSKAFSKMYGVLVQVGSGRNK